MSGADVPAADETAADAALGDFALEDVNLSQDDVSVPEGYPVHEDQQGRGTRSSAASTNCGTNGDKHAAD